MLRTPPGLAFVSGAGTDSSERGRTMWARVKGEAEKALLAMPVRGARMLIRTLHAIRSRTAFSDLHSLVIRPLVPPLLRVPSVATTMKRFGRATPRLARREGRGVVESRELDAPGSG